MTNYDWRVQVRVTGKRDGWSRTLVDTPAFELRSNAQFGGVWSSPDTVAKVARDMFAGLVEPDDQIQVTVSSADDSTKYAIHTFGGVDS